MFIAGIIAAGVAGTIGVIAHSDHSDYSDYYSDYSDYAEKERKRKKAELNGKNSQKLFKRDIEKRLMASLDEDKAALKDINDTLKRINEIQLKVKNDIKVKK